MNQNNAYNPFNITKAVDYTDSQINQAWVDLQSVDGKFTDMVKPTMSMPMLILGGKGSGKTHIMRYFSYGLQKIRYGKNLKKNLVSDKYVGIYMRCGGLNSKRFSSKGISQEHWVQIFSYYMDLWLAQLVIDALQDILSETNFEYSLEENNLVLSFIDLFDKPVSLDSYTLIAFKKYLNSVQKKVDYEINQLSLTKGNISEKIEILSSPGKLIFGIPKLIEKNIAYFSEFQFLYLIDEFENLEEYHQRYFNTLIREKEYPATFRIGVRLYGIKTYETFSGGELIKEGSEYELFNIDTFLRNHKGYEKYMIEICRKRLELSGYPNYNRPINEYFEEFSVSYLNEILYNISVKSTLNHFVKLKNKLKSSNFRVDTIDDIVSNLQFEKDFVIERTNVFLFYRFWKENSSREYLLSVSEIIKKDASFYFEKVNIKKTRHHIILDKFKNDIVDQLCRENGIDLPYYGFNNFVTMSSGIPRVLLKTLKEIFKQSFFNGEKPFFDGKISKKAQMKGLKISSEWFIDDASPMENKMTKIALLRLGNFLREIKFSDIPPECSISIFSVNISHIDENSARTINMLKNYSYIIDVSERREKNGNAINQTYQINGIITPKWELSIHRRGVIPLTRKEVKAIFSESKIPFDDILEERIKKYNYPFSGSKDNLTLFDNDSN